MKGRLSVLQSIYFYVLAFNEVEKTKKFCFFHHAASFLSVLYQISDKNCLKKKVFVLQMLYKECSENERWLT